MITNTPLDRLLFKLKCLYYCPFKRLCKSQIIAMMIVLFIILIFVQMTGLLLALIIVLLPGYISPQHLSSREAQ